MTSPSNRPRLRRICLGLIGMLYVFSVPWYREATEPLTLRLGMPDWVAVAVVCYVAVAILNAVAWILTEIPDSPDDAIGRDASRGPEYSNARSDEKPSEVSR